MFVDGCSIFWNLERMLEIVCKKEALGALPHFMAMCVCYNKQERRLWVSCHISWICVLPYVVEAWRCFLRKFKASCFGKNQMCLLESLGKVFNDTCWKFWKTEQQVWPEYTEQLTCENGKPPVKPCFVEQGKPTGWSYEDWKKMFFMDV